MSQDLLSIGDVARIAHIPPARVRAWATRRGIPRIRQGRYTRYAPDPVYAAVAAEGPPAPPPVEGAAERLDHLVRLHRMVCRARVGAL